MVSVTILLYFFFCIIVAFTILSITFLRLIATACVAEAPCYDMLEDWVLDTHVPTLIFCNGTTFFLFISFL